MYRLRRQCNISGSHALCSRQQWSWYVCASPVASLCMCCCSSTPCASALDAHATIQHVNRWSTLQRNLPSMIILGHGLWQLAKLARACVLHMGVVYGLSSHHAPSNHARTLVALCMHEAHELLIVTSKLDHYTKSITLHLGSSIFFKTAPALSGVAEKKRRTDDAALASAGNQRFLADLLRPAHLPGA